MKTFFFLWSILLLISSIVTAQNAPSISGLAAYWPLDGNAIDNYGNRNGTVNGVAFVADRFGQAGKASSFDGVDDYIDLDSDFTFDLSSAFTISMWQYIPSGAKTSWSPFIGKNLNSDGYWMIHTGANITFYQDYYNSAYYIWNSGFGYGDEIPYDTWVHLTLTSEPVDAQNIKLRIYLNGEFKKSTTFDLSPRPVTQFSIRYFGRANSDRFFEGRLDDIMVFNRQLSSSEINSLYQYVPGSSGWISSQSGIFYTDGNVGIGTARTSFGGQSFRLSVDGSIRTREVAVAVDSWSDFVFEKDYELMPLPKVEAYIEANGHLPGIPSQHQVLEEGIKLGEMDARLLQKVEELTLYVIELNKKLAEVQERNSALEKEISILKKQ